jgi:predicted metal-binding membrane protein
MSAVASLAVASLRRNRLLGLLGLLCLASWAWSLRMATQLQGAHHHGSSLLPLTAMWAAMMVAMMVPPEVPRLLWLARAERAVRGPVAFLGGYLAPWMVVSLGTALLQTKLQSAGMLTGEMATASHPLGATVLLAVGAVQFSPLKRACLERCRFRALLPAPAGESSAGSFLRGLRHGALTVGSCGVLMLVLFVAGVMSPVAMVLLTSLLLAENLAPSSWRVSTLAGLVLLLWGAGLLLL